MNLEPLSLRILSALFNGGYQGLLLTAIVWVGLRLLPHTNASTRHAAGLATLLVVAALPAVHFLMAGAPGVQVKESAAPQPKPQPQPHPRPQLPDERRQRDFVTLAENSRRIDASESQGVLKAQTSARAGVGREVALQREAAVSTQWADEGGATPGIDRGSKGLAVSPSTSQRWQASLPARVALGLAGLWAVFASLRLAKLVGECRLLSLLKRRGVVPSERLRTEFEALRREMGVGRRTGLLLVPIPAAPMAVGFFRPAVLLPKGVFRGSTWGALDQILRHELAHLRRWDDWANLLQQLVRCTLFFHPAVWWLSRRLTLDREIACDDHVLAAAPAPRAYALFLTEFAGRDHYRNCSAAPAGWSRKSQLQQRITMILDPNRNASTTLAKARAGVIVAAAAFLAVLSLHAAPRLELSRASSSGADANAPSGDSAASSQPSVVLATTTTSGSKAIISDDGVVSINCPVEHKASSSVAVSVDAKPKPIPAPRPVVAVAVDVQPVQPQPVLAPRPVIQPIPAPVPQPALAPAAPPVLADAAPRAAAAPKRMARSTAEDDESVEQRLDRLERLIETLLDTKGDRPEMGKERKFKPDGKPEAGLDMKWDFKMDMENWELLGPEKIEEITREAQRHAERAAREAERMAEEARRTAMNAYNRAVRDSNSNSHEHQRKMLESQRHALELQIGNLEAQIARLEEERDRIEARVEEQEGLIEQLEEQVEDDEEQEEHNHDHEDDGDVSRDRKPPRPAAESSRGPSR